MHLMVGQFPFSRKKVGKRCATSGPVGKELQCGLLLYATIFLCKKGTKSNRTTKHVLATLYKHVYFVVCPQSVLSMSDIEHTVST